MDHDKKMNLLIEWKSRDSAEQSTAYHIQLFITITSYIYAERRHISTVCVARETVFRHSYAGLSHIQHTICML